MDEDDVVRALGALANPLRLKLFRLLVVAGKAGLTPGAITEAVGIASTTLSFHLKELSHAGLVSQERDGRYLIYRASFERMNGLLGYLTANCCEGEICEVAASPSCDC
ncbi:MAG TPA: metalloregulator ArsR/SmtB family transcription factor [Albitalea sp.]